MKPWNWLKLAVILQALGTVGHTMATQNPPSRGPEEQAVFSAMRSFHFTMMGSARSHWDFYKGYELSITVAFALLAVLLWQLSSLSRTAPELARPLIVTIIISEIFLSMIGWIYFFAAPGVTSLLIALCLIAALLSMRRTDQVSLATRRQSEAG
jgi:hypothetical protein